MSGYISSVLKYMHIQVVFSDKLLKYLSLIDDLVQKMSQTQS